MPARHRIKQYTEDSYYHIYNRGVEKRLIFLDEQDYAVFHIYLKEYLTPKNEGELQQKIIDPNISYKEKGKILKLLRLKNYADEITLLAYCLMPNHFHFLLKQKNAQSIEKFMQSLFIRYTMYFNKKYQRVGNLCQDIYKAVLVSTDEQFLYLSSYIHRQALASQGPALQGKDQPSSYPEYLGQRQTEWVHPENILGYFSQTNPQMDYRSFVEQKESEDDDILPILSMIIDI